MLPPYLQISRAARLLLSQPQTSCRALYMQVSAAAGGLPDERISLIQLVLEAISLGQCQILQLLQEHRTRIARSDPQTANRACLQELRETPASPDAISVISVSDDDEEPWNSNDDELWN
jgi:hypothetical protein